MGRGDRRGGRGRAGQLRAYLSSEIVALLDQSRFRDALDGTIVGGGDGRVDDVLLPRLDALAGP